jgi:uncharacterized protein (DUF1800 family)
MKVVQNHEQGEVAVLADEGLASSPELSVEDTARRLCAVQGAALLLPVALAACGGGGGDQDPTLNTASQLAGYSLQEPAKAAGMSARDASRFLTQATFGIRALAEVTALSETGPEYWLWQQFNAPVQTHTSYLDVRREKDPKTGQLMDAYEHYSYEAIWRQWLFDDAGQLRARVAFALSQILVISNIAPDIKPYAMSSYMDMLNRNAFGNFRTLLKEVTLHPAMGYYLNMLESEKENPDTGTHPNENYAREILQLFSIGLVKLNEDGTPVTGVPTYNEDVVKGFARAFSGWSFGGQSPQAGQTMDDLFEDSDYNDARNWTTPLRAYPTFHETGTKLLLDGVTLPAGQTPEKDMDDALDNIFNHPNVPPFICRQLIQRLVTSNPTARYVSEVVAVFKDNGAGVRGDLRAVVQAILLHDQARGDDAVARTNYGKLREPIIRLTNYLRALDVKPKDALGTSDFWALFGDELPLGQHPLLAPSVFNFFSPGFRISSGAGQTIAAPELQITNETTMVGTYNVFYYLAQAWGDERFGLKLDYEPWRLLARQPAQLVDRLDATLFCHQMTAATRARLLTMLGSMPADGEWEDRLRLKAALVLASVSTDFVVQK